MKEAAGPAPMVVDGEADGPVAAATPDSEEERWPAPVRACHVNFSFPLDKCVQAYSLFAGTGPDDVIVEQMINFMVSAD